MAAKRYAKGGIYMVVDAAGDDPEFYVGSSVNMPERAQQHHRKYQISKRMREWRKDVPRIEVIVIEVLADCTLAELRAREYHWIAELNPSLNARQTMGPVDRYQLYERNSISDPTPSFHDWLRAEVRR